MAAVGCVGGVLQGYCLSSLIDVRGVCLTGGGRNELPLILILSGCDQETPGHAPRGFWVGLGGFLGAFVQSRRLLQKLGTAQAVDTAAAIVWVPGGNHSRCAIARDALKHRPLRSGSQGWAVGAPPPTSTIDVGQGQFRFGSPGKVPGG